MGLWTDVIDPATLTGYARASLDQLEDASAPFSLAQWLPRRQVSDVVVRFVAGSAGFLPDEAKFRAWDTGPEPGKGVPSKRVTLELPALGREEIVPEYDQLRIRNAGTGTVEDAILRATRNNVRAVFNTMERLRATVLSTGRATVSQDNFHMDDDFGRTPDHDVQAATSWSDPAADRLQDLQDWSDTYELTNGVEPGALLMNRRVWRILQSGNQFQTQLINGGARRPTDQEVRNMISAAGLPDIYVYNRRTAAGYVLPDDGTILMLPAPTSPSDEEYELGGTFWGQTLTSADPEYSLADTEQPGLVVGTYRNDKPPLIAQVISDAIGMPVLANANLSLRAKVVF